MRGGSDPSGETYTIKWGRGNPDTVGIKIGDSFTFPPLTSGCVWGKPIGSDMWGYPNSVKTFGALDAILADSDRVISPSVICSN